MREELQKYLDKVYTGAKIGAPYSITRNVHIRFELSSNEIFKVCRNGSEFEYFADNIILTEAEKLKIMVDDQKRIIQATSRATTLFYDIFENLETEIWVLIYEYPGDLGFIVTDYLYQQIPPKTLATFYDNIEQVDMRMWTDLEVGTFFLDKIVARVVLGKVKVKDIQAEKIFNGIANALEGLEYSICQNVFFLDPILDRGMYMYDYRRCYVWSDIVEKIQFFYVKRNQWIDDCVWPEIDLHLIK